MLGWYGSIGIICGALIALLWLPRRRRRVRLAAEDDRPETTLIRMIELRRKIDKRIKSLPAPNRWIIFDLWASPEGRLLTKILNALWLEDGGMSRPAAWARVCPLPTEQILAAGTPEHARHLAVKGILAEVDPEYLALGDAFIGRLADHAERWAMTELTKLKTTPQWPSSDWTIDSLSYDQFVDEALTEDVLARGFDRLTRELVDIAERYVPGDEIRTFRSPAETWQTLGGRAGYVLVRRGHPIGRAVTLMN